MRDEIREKLSRVAAVLERHKLDGVMLWNRNNFAWLTGGAENRIANNSPAGVAALYATKDKIVCLANTIETPRMKAEEVGPLGIDVVSFDWWDRADAQKVAKDVIGSAKVAGDTDEFGLGLGAVPDEFNKLRWTLTTPEIERFRTLGKLTAGAIEKACRRLKSGMNEHEVAGVLDDEIRKTKANPVVTLIASDERITNFRHPIAVDKMIDKAVMLVTCAEKHGLICNVTRFVSFAPLTDEQMKKQQAVCNIDAAVNLATKPGRTLDEVFKDLQAAYAKEGFADQWKNHHQGGPCGYAGREAFGVPGSALKVLDSQAYAWNPSVPGAKSEDTVLVSKAGVEVLSACTNDWPTVAGVCAAGELRRAGILVA